MLYVHQKPPHAISAKEVIEHLHSDGSFGLANDEAEKRLKKNGPNMLAGGKNVSAVQIFLRQFKSAIIVILVFSAAVSFYINQLIEAYVVSAIIIIVTIIGFYHEYNAENILESLRKLVVTRTRVMRDSRLTDVSSREVVAGDVIFLESGDKVPADARIVRSNGLSVDESSITGESVPVQKADCILAENTPLAERKNSLFMGSYVSGGNALAIITHTGAYTQMGLLAKEVPEEQETPLQQSISDFGKRLSFLVAMLGIFLIAFELLKGVPLYSILLISVAVAVSGIPESLPIIITIGLAHGVYAMAKKNALVRKMDAVETLGCVSVICSDKTGTLTKNEMTVTKIYANDSVIDVTGRGYEPQGAFLLDGKEIKPQGNETLSRLLVAGILCNNARIKKEDALWRVLGDSTEGSLIVLGKKAGFLEDKIASEYARIDETAFSQERKCMSTVHKKGNQKYLFSKGAINCILGKCTRIEKNGKVFALTKKEKEKIHAACELLSGQSLRVLALAYKADASKKVSEDSLTFLGLVGIKDPVREGVKESIEACKRAGIRTVMITGDHATTATAIAREIGLIGDKGLVVDGDELDKTSDEEFLSIVEKVAVYARATAQHKLRIIDALEKRGHIVAMTGDGINDAIALKKAHVGISMGQKGTDVAKDASDISLLDDNFNTIVSAVKEGRATYENLKTATQFALSITCAEVGVIVLAILFGMPLPITALMVLFINLVTDDLPAIGMSMSAAKKDIMDRKPRKEGAQLIDRNAARSIILAGSTFTLAVIGIFLANYFYYGESLQRSQTLAFALLMTMEILFAYGIRADRIENMRHAFSNKYLNATVLLASLAAILAIEHPLLQAIFKTTGLSLSEWAFVGLGSFAVVAGVVYMLSKEHKQRNKEIEGVKRMVVG